MEGDLEESISEWDDPNRAVDKLNRTEFAERVCRGLKKWSAPESLVVAVYGEWGDGKTWLLNTIGSLLSKENDVIVCRFCPWQYESNEQITAEFFALVLEQLDSDKDQSITAKKRASLWRSLGQMVTVGQIGAFAYSSMNHDIESVSTALGSLGELLEMGGEKAANEGKKRGVGELRRDLIKLFEAENAPRILVAIDDLDRLEDEQIQMVLRLVKTNANFPNLDYLILGERKQLAGALNPISNQHGDRYLEKIVHIPLTLPKASNQEIQHRLWEGLEDIAASCSFDLEKNSQRFERCWDGFLKRRLTNFRSVHRLLTTVSFHAKCLTVEGLLEVDLLDLLGIDFVRIFAPNFYQLLANDPPTESWASLHKHWAFSQDEEQQDSEAAITLIKSSDLGFESTYNFLAILFPPVSKILPKLGQEQRFLLRNNEGARIEIGQRPVWHDQFASFYFQLSTQAGDLPLSRYRLFLRTDSARDLIKLLDDWSSNGWRRQLLGTLKEDLQFTESITRPKEFLVAIASISDDLNPSGEGVDMELDNAISAWFKQFEKIREDERFETIEYVFKNTRGISIPLLVLEYLRDQSGATFFDGARALQSIPALEREEIEKLTDDFMPQVRNRFSLRKFPVDPEQGNRFYRLAHAIGPERMESLLREELDNEGGWAISKAVVHSLIAPLRLDLFEIDSVIPEASKNIVTSLCQFASKDYWSAFRKQALESQTQEPLESVVLDHIANGIQVMNEEFKNETQ